MKLGDISPLAGMITGEGAMGKLIGKGFGGVLPAAIARNAQKDREREEAEAAEIAAAEAAEGRSTQGMKKGGKVSSASSRADGCAQRGKTKGRVI
jgi:hypothetical protein